MSVLFVWFLYLHGHLLPPYSSPPRETHRDRHMYVMISCSRQLTHILAVMCVRGQQVLPKAGDQPSQTHVSNEQIVRDWIIV